MPSGDGDGAGYDLLDAALYSGPCGDG
jgi:hypothetical protein